MGVATMTRAATTGINEEACWQAVLDRREAADGLFVVAVKTTRIYCRPTCPSRTPYRRNVTFYTTPTAAEGAGFRACKRCRPRDEARPAQALVRAVCRRLDAGDAPALAALAREFAVSPFHLQRTFKRIMGVTPREYSETKRTQLLKDGLRTAAGVASAGYDAGLGSSSRLYERSERLGMTPGAYRRGGAGMRISYTTATCDFGRMIVAATERGISAVSFAEDDGALEDALRKEYPRAVLTRDDAALRTWVERVVRAIAGRPEARTLPLDIRATAFQAAVWAALRTIPPGETRTYGELARAVGRPKAVRAVGNACRDNPVAVIIPCHRAVAAGAKGGGYRWGMERKRALLDRERKAR